MRGHPVKALCTGLCCAVAMNCVGRGDFEGAMFPLLGMVGWLLSTWGDDA